MIEDMHWNVAIVSIKCSGVNVYYLMMLMLGSEYAPYILYPKFEVKGIKLLNHGDIYEKCTSKYNNENEAYLYCYWQCRRDIH